MCDLSLTDRIALEAWSTVYVDLEAAINVPFHSLTKPAVLEPVAHLERYDLVVALHQVIEQAYICRLVLIIEEVRLD